MESINDFGAGRSDDQPDGVTYQSEREQNNRSDGVKSGAEYTVGFIAGGSGRGRNRRGSRLRLLRSGGGRGFALAGTSLNDRWSDQRH
jgi:hypothetical protein